VSRAWSVYAGLFLLLGALAFVAWMSRSPEARFFDQAERWAVIGPRIAELRDLYRDSSKPRRGTGRRGRLDRGDASLRSDLEDEEREPIEMVWIGLGAELRSAPDAGARSLHKTQSLASYRVLARRGRWLQVSGEGLEVSRENGATAWYDPEAPRDRTPPLGMGTEPVLPVEALAADPSRLELVRSALGIGAVEGELEGYRLITDVDDAAALEELGRQLARVEEVYRQSYGVTPIGRPAETVALFRREQDYRGLEQRIAELSGAETLGHASRGTVALFVGDRRLVAAASTLIHEVGHLLNRRALGPALPLWLNEGIAEDLGHFALPAALEPDRGPYDGQRIEIGDRQILFIENLGALVALRTAVFRGELPSLVALTGADSEPFVVPEASPRFYAQTGFLIRWLRTSRKPELVQFLRSIAAGGPATGEALRSHLGADWDQLEREFRAYLEQQAQIAGVPDPTVETGS
jgi:hypothetical protein